MPNLPVQAATTVSQLVSIANYGADPSLADNTVPIQAALDAVAKQGGGDLLVPAGVWKHSFTLNVGNNTRFHGEGRNASRLQNTGTGHGLLVLGPVNVVSQCNVLIENLWLTGGGAMSAGILNVAAGNFEVSGCNLAGYDHGIVMNQTECGSVSKCSTACTTSGVWIMNSGELPGYPTTNSGFTSVIRVADNNFGGGKCGIIDDGGYAHMLGPTNNFSGQSVCGISLAGCIMTRVDCNYFEIGGVPILLDNVHTWMGRTTGTGPQGYVNSNVTVSDNFIEGVGGINVINGTITVLNVTGNFFAPGKAVALVNPGNVGWLSQHGNQGFSADGNYCQAGGLASGQASQFGVGIGCLNPRSALDVHGGISLRAVQITLVGGADNGDVAIPNNASTVEMMQLTGGSVSYAPGVGFAVSGFTGGVDGRLLDFHNYTTSPMQVRNMATSSSTGNRICTMTGLDAVRTSVARFKYSASKMAWVLLP